MDAPAPRRLVLCALAAALAAAGCEVRAGEREPAARNLLFLSIDTLRADALGTYGYPRGTSPAIDAFAETAVVFEDCQASSSWTLPTMASLFTSAYTSAHGCWDNETLLDGSWTTLAEVLRDAGWRTGAVTTHLYVSRRYGLDQGFDDFDDGILRATGRGGAPNPHKLVSSPWVNERALAWLRARTDDEPWFLWLHYFDPHHKFKRHAGVSERFGTDSPRDRYDGEVAFTDRHVGEVLDALERFGLADDTVVVLVADHGEEFGEHGEQGHRKNLHGEVLRVPLIVRVPGVEPRRVPGRVRTVDVLPTLLDLLRPEGAPDRSGLAGESLVDALEGRPLAPRPALAELRAGRFEFDGVLDGRWKLLVDGAGGAQLFDLVADPLETEDLAPGRPDVVADLRARLRDLRDAARVQGAARASETRALTAEETQYLRALGYVDDGAPADDAPGTDPD